MSEVTLCPFCDEEVQPHQRVTAREKGIATIKSLSNLRCDGIAAKLNGKAEVTFHGECRKAYTRRASQFTPAAAQKRSTSSENQAPTRVLRDSLDSNFDIRMCCFVCGDALRRRPGGPADHPRLVMDEASRVTEPSLHKTVIDTAARRSDQLGGKVHARIAHLQEFHTLGAVYHQRCLREFLHPGRRSASDLVSPPMKRVKASPAIRSPDTAKREAFGKLCEFIESSEDPQFSVPELLEKMRVFSGGESYSYKWLHKLLREKYADDVVFSTVPGRPTVLSFKGTAARLLTEDWLRGRNSSEEERMKVVARAAKILLEDIRSCVYDLDHYPSVDDIASGGSEQSVCATLRLLLDILIKTGKKGSTARYDRTVQALSHAVTAAVRPRSFVSPILLSLAVHLHRVFGSRDLVDILHALGVCSSYNEALRFEDRIVSSGSPEVDPEGYLQFVWDNFDFNVRTLDGYNTFHVLGGIMIVTPCATLHVPGRLPRSRRTTEDPAEDAYIPFISSKLVKGSGLRHIAVQDVTDRISGEDSGTMKCGKQYDLLWMGLRSFREGPVPSWAGYMDTCHRRTAEIPFETSAIVPLPFVNSEPSNPSTIYSAMYYSVEKCLRRNQSKCMVTFDCPLYLKAVDIVHQVTSISPLKNVIVRLGGFHLLMSFMATVGYLMAGSGLEELFNVVYAKNTVAHMLAGKAYARALRAHFLVQAAIFSIITNCKTDLSSSLKLSVLAQAEKAFWGNEATPADAASHENVSELSRIVQEARDTACKSRTATLWLQYFDQVEIMRLFIRAERIGDWDLHLECVGKMLPYFHSCAHLNYSKAAQIYFQEMTALESKLTVEEYDKFVRRGFFTVRRSNKLWAGIWTDMTIEQCLMRAMKAQGGITRGRGLSSKTISRWISAMPMATQIRAALETFTGTRGVSSEQHVDMRDSRQLRDHVDYLKFLQWLLEHNPFQERLQGELVSVSSGIVADETVHCEKAASHGLQVMSRMSAINENFGDMSLRRKDRLLSLATISRTLSVGEENVPVNVTQLFHRIIVTSEGDEDLKHFLSHELAPWPTSIFDDGLLRKNVKSSLVPELSKIVPSHPLWPNNPVVIIDGGFLLHRVVWPRPATFSRIAETYAQYIISHYGHECTVVFDGYLAGPSTKDEEHRRRGLKPACTDVTVEENVLPTVLQSSFLNNGSNKSKLITLLSQVFQSKGMPTLQAAGDADRLIVTTALQGAESGRNTCVVGNDTDVLVLLISLAPPGSSLYMVMPGADNKPDKVFNCSAMHSALGEIASFLPFVHAMTGCDTTSALYAKGKAAALKKIRKVTSLHGIARVFVHTSSSPEEVAAAGETFLLELYGVARLAQNLDEARFILYRRTVARQGLTSKFQLAALPPTSNAARFHSYRVYLQVQLWLGREVDPIAWGWVLLRNSLCPVRVTAPPVPTELLRLLYCSCRSGCERKCSCASANRACSAMCTHCAGADCTNQSSYVDMESEEEDDVDEPSDEEPDESGDTE